MGLGIAIKVNGMPDPDLISATAVEVTENANGKTEFNLRYDADIGEGDLPLLVDNRLDAGSEITILVPVNSSNQCLVKGSVHSHRIHFHHGGAGSWLEVMGSDSSIIMDRESRSIVWSDQSDSDVVSSILAIYGYSPDVENTPA